MTKRLSRKGANVRHAIRLLLLPMVGSGYNGAINAVMALQGDLTTVAGFAVTGHQETPGLGARIEEPAWLAQFSGRQTRDERGQLRFAVARGPAGSVHEVDGITGATRTTNGISQWLSGDEDLLHTHRMRALADAVVVGGGTIGAWTAWFLKHAGLSRVVLIEAETLFRAGDPVDGSRR